MIEVRNAVTGHSKHFENLQQIADFLPGRPDAAEWEGYQGIGPLPAPSESAATTTMGEEIAVAVAAMVKRARKPPAKKPAAKVAPTPAAKKAPAKKAARRK